MKMLRKDEGFTLVELMVVVLIIGILVAIAVPVFLNASASARLNSCFANQRTIEGAISTYNASAQAGATFVDGTIGGTTAGTKATDLTGTALQAVPHCPGAGTAAFYNTAAGTVNGDNYTAAGATGANGAGAWYADGTNLHKHY